MVRRVLDLRPRGNFNQLQKVEFRTRVFLALHDQHILEALMVFLAVLDIAVTKTGELEAFKRLTNAARIECTGAFYCISIKQCLAVNRVGCL